VEKKRAITYAVLAATVLVPYIFESLTFHLYITRDPEFFTFSGARLWMFLISNILLGFWVGMLKTHHPVVLCAIAAIAACLLVIVLYHLCDVRQCYYPGPDGLGEFRLAALLISATSCGILAGSVYRHLGDKPAVAATVFGCFISIFVGYFPWALIFNTYLTSETGLAMFVFASTAPFLCSGAASHLFSRNVKHAICSAAAGWVVLTLLFAGLRPVSAPLALAILACAILSALAGFRLISYANSAVKNLKTLALLTGLFGFFILGALHPLIDAPMSLAPEDDIDLMPKPTYYSGAYHYSETYFSSKRVEVEINLTQFNANSINDFLFAGMGAQSPNCCKDGLDYGYRADLFFNESGSFLAARAWETCDFNVACSGHPWASEMHKSIVGLPTADVNFKTITLAMEWQPDGQTVKWYYGTSPAEWVEFSSFVSPEIGNPYFNLGVISVANPFTNPDTGSAYFFQVGISRPAGGSNAFGSIRFHCPSYHDRDENKQCVELEPIARGNSHWKVLWKWGIQDPRTAIEIGRSYAKITLA
jgi:hypothetical protein